MSKRLTTAEFIERARQVHGNRYDYSKVDYINSKTKVCIICPIHGEFCQIPDGHLVGHGCLKCGGKDRLQTDEFINRAKKIHGNRYDYSKVNYINDKSKVCIICPDHGEFWQTPNGHLHNRGCKKCGAIKLSKLKSSNTNDFINKAIKIHNNIYDYSKVHYINANTKVCIVCSEHGEFWMTPHNHLVGQGCPKCRYLKISVSEKLSTEEFIQKANKVHHFKYDYSNTLYDSSRDKVRIKCPIHGEFTQKANNHLNGCGCPKCKQSKLENYIYDTLMNSDIYFKTGYSPNWLFLRKGKRQHLDFYLPEYNIAIECQGKQHFEPITFGSRENRDKIFKYIKLLDENKHRLCKEHNVKLIYYTDLKNYNTFLGEKLIKNKEELLTLIKNGGE